MIILCAVLTACASARAQLNARIHDVKALAQFARVGAFPTGQSAVSCETVICNIGDQVIPWQAPMSPNHPFIAYSMYRLHDGRFEQIGRSWAKHTFAVNSQFFCGPCVPAGAAALGVGCADTYSNSANASQFYLGPREEIDPFSGAWEPCGSFFDALPQDCLRHFNGSGLGPLDHRCAVSDVDLNLPGASYFYEAMYVVPGDVDPLDNVGSRLCTMFWNGASWVFSTPLDNNAIVRSPAIATRYLSGGPHEALGVAADPGSVYVASKATDLGGGAWHYEYAVYNFNYARRIRGFSVPVPPAATVTNVEFRDGDGEPLNDWTGVFDASCGAVTWQTSTHAQDPQTITLVWGTLYNFRFDADVSPAGGDVALDPFLPGAGSPRLWTSVVTPDIGCLKGDVNGDGLVNGDDIQPFVAALFDPPCELSRVYCAADLASPAPVPAMVSRLLAP